MDQMDSNLDWKRREPQSDDEETAPPSHDGSEGFKLGFWDICYILYRHKWKIILCSLGGFAAAAAIYLTAPTAYFSEAKVMVHYVPERRSLGPTVGETEANRPRTTVIRGEELVGSELEILRSSDLAERVAEMVGPERILAKAGGGNDLQMAARIVRNNTEAYPSAGNVITITFQHLDPEVVQPVLSKLISQYFTNHFKIHSAVAFLEENRMHQLLAKEQLEKADAELREFKKKEGVFSLEEAKKDAAANIRKIEEALNDARTDFARNQELLSVMPHSKSKEPLPLNPEEQEKLMEKYAGIVTEWDLARKNEVGLLGQYKSESRIVSQVHEKVVEMEKKKKEMEKEYPILLGLSGNPTNEFLNPLFESRKEPYIKATLTALSNRLQQARSAEAAIYELEAPYMDLQRKRDLAENQYRWFSTEVEQAQANSALGASRYSNISPVESPTAPDRLVKPLFKKIVMAIAAGVGSGIGLALLLELFVDQRIKRPADVHRLLQVPIYVSIPKLPRKRRAKQLAYKPRLLGEGSGVIGDFPLETLNHHDDAELPYFEALRDRVLNRFATLARKPKLVGVCGCSGGQGGTNTAAGLAAALSEAGELKVLLVDMKIGRGRATGPADGKKACTLLDALEQHKRQEGQIAPNLYLASAEGGGKERVITSPTRFRTVVPQLNASDYDFIVFDLPSVDQVSVTPRLAKHMDLTLLVIEAEKTNRNVVKQAGDLLLEFTPHVAVVVNNTQANLPKWLESSLAS